MATILYISYERANIRTKSGNKIRTKSGHNEDKIDKILDQPNYWDKSWDDLRGVLISVKNPDIGCLSSIFMDWSPKALAS